ncbi:LacI family transcriptional regulator [Croceibacterium mercuriale]|uniref:LacI family transcriptional regulator n=1 Tax=Croceibacterium mercuriale TaxID=1572751 RepID=A0A0B2BY03_9SPHN|nr:LacI family DNA-binding transcriptional regulator [Croceibacterium mercuriale]KHL26314.1 LacI family transcriptional regulator [Croceibacterium mercuriale]
MTRRQVTRLADIAALAGVTPATVSRALSGHAQISPATRQKVLAIAHDHGFRINQTARNLRLGRTQAIGVVIPLGHPSAQRVSDPFYTALIGLLMEGLALRGHAMLLSTGAPEDAGWLDSLALSGRVDGIIVLCQSDQDARLREVARAYRPLIVWGEAMEGYCCVGTDNRAGGRLATEHLLAAGRRRIAYAGMTDIPELAARHAGYLAALAAAGVAPGPQIAVPLSFDPQGAQADMGAIDGTIDSVVAASDVIAMGVIRALAGSGRTVPDDVAVIGYDDVSLAAHVMPALTTVRQDLERAATIMLDLLFRRIDGEEAASVRLPPQLVVRQSG